MTEKEIESFFNQKVYPHFVKYLKSKETYISWLFFTGDYAYKIKRPVKFSYLDFSSLPKRKYFLEEELRLNRRISRDIYLDVVPIIKRGSRIKILESSIFSLPPKAKIIDYALKMREIPEKYYMPVLIKKGKIRKYQIDKIAKIVADFHKKAGLAPELKKFDFLKIVEKNWEENFKNVKNFTGETIRKPIFYFIKRKVKSFLKENKKLFKERQKSGKIKDCHGDLHANNIFITPPKVQIIDCIEFNKRFRFGDTVSDVAFLSMDLEFLNREDLADYFIKRYIFWSKDAAILKFLDFYKCYFAFVKGKVANFSLKIHPVKSRKAGTQSLFTKRAGLVNRVNNPEEKKKEAERYFSLAFKYAVNFSKSPPFLIVICGNIGTGKSYLTKHLQALTGFSRLQSDVIRKKTFEIPPFSRKKEKINQGIYDKGAIRGVYEKMIDAAFPILSKNKSVILDATFAKKIFRDKVIVLAKKIKVPYIFIECQLSEKIILERLKKRKKEKEVSDADIYTYFKKKKEFEPIKISKAHYLGINTNFPISLQLDRILKRLLTP